MSQKWKGVMAFLLALTALFGQFDQGAFVYAKKTKAAPQKAGAASATVNTQKTQTTNAMSVAKRMAGSISKKTPVKKKVKKPSLIREISNGKVKGKKTSSGKSMVWYGIPYAATTAGENRWREPQPAEDWSGVKKATKKKKKAIHYSSNAKGYKGTENCLYVNVYRPYTRKKNLPVLVFLHGGGNTKGTANLKFAAMAKAMNVVIVSVSYRLGAFGFFYHPALQQGNAYENSGNFTLLDIHAALEWVQDEIDVFGGSPDNVTLSGFSSGARDALMCMVSPIMSGLFDKAFIMSGGFTFSSLEDGKDSAEMKLAAILVERGQYTSKAEARKYLSSLDDEQMRNLFQGLSKAEIAGMYRTGKLRLTDFPQGFLDGVVLPTDWKEAIIRGEYNRVPVLIGSDVTEFSSFGWNAGLTAFDQYWQETNGITQIMDLVGKAIRYGSELQTWFYIENTIRQIYEDANHEPVYAFRMKWGTSESVVGSEFYCNYVGAYHGQIRDFLLGAYKHRLSAYAPYAVSEENVKGRKALSKQMRNFLKRFMKTGNPNGSGIPTWNKWRKAADANKIMILKATKKKETSEMSSEMFNQEDIFQSMRADLSLTEYTALTQTIFVDRFFMPEVVPEYVSVG